MSVIDANIDKTSLLSFAGPVEKVGPLRASLFAADPEHCRYSDNQGHQILYKEQREVRSLMLGCLTWKIKQNMYSISTGTFYIYGIKS